MKPQEKLIKIAEKEIGYLEKKSNSDLDSKTGNAESANYTKYARDLYPALQGQPWCDMFVDWCFVQAFGEIKARQLIGGGFSAYTPTSAQYYKNKGQYHKNDPQPGDQIFFRGNQRICHTGIVAKVEGGTVHTIEGNTSGASGVIANGGGVCKKVYPIGYFSIDGYGRPDWSIVDAPTYEVGWNRDDKGWWYADTESTYYKDCWQIINHHWYYLGADGYMLTGWQQIGGKWYYLEESGDYEGACWHERPGGSGALERWGV